MAKVSELCGEYPSNFIKLDISNDPTFVFENDPNYTIKQLFDSEGNTVSVNSFIECEHYVSGGWDYSPYETKEAGYYTTVAITLIFGIIIYSFINKYISKIKND